MSDVFDLPEVRSRIRLQLDAQLRILGRIEDEIELSLPNDPSTEVFRLWFGSMVDATREAREEWSE